MLDWISQNKVWLLSGLGTALVVGLAGFLSRYLKKPSGEKQTQRAASESVAIQAGGSIQAGGNIVINQLSPNQLNERLLDEAKPKEDGGETHVPIVNMTVQEILSEIDSRPLFQRDEARQHYIGIRIRFSGKMSWLSKVESNRVRLAICPIDMSFPRVYATMNVDEYPELKILHQDAPVTIEGKIEEFEYGDVKLTDCHLCR